METKKYDGMCITGFVFGILSATLYFILIFAPFCAIIFSSIGIARTSTREKKGRALAIWGLILGIIFTIQIAIKLYLGIGL